MSGQKVSRKVPFEVVIKHNPEMNVWYVYKYIDTHNHVMARSNEVGLLLSHRRISDRQKKRNLSIPDCWSKEISNYGCFGAAIWGTS